MAALEIVGGQKIRFSEGDKTYLLDRDKETGKFEWVAESQSHPIGKIIPAGKEIVHVLNRMLKSSPNGNIGQK